MAPSISHRQTSFLALSIRTVALNCSLSCQPLQYVKVFRFIFPYHFIAKFDQYEHEILVLYHHLFQLMISLTRSQQFKFTRLLHSVEAAIQFWWWYLWSHFQDEMAVYQQSFDMHYPSLLVIFQFKEIGCLNAPYQASSVLTLVFQHLPILLFSSNHTLPKSLSELTSFTYGIQIPPQYHPQSMVVSLVKFLFKALLITQIFYQTSSNSYLDQSLFSTFIKQNFKPIVSHSSVQFVPTNPCLYHSLLNGLKLMAFGDWHSIRFP